MSESTNTQMDMFGAEVLPLFSGTPQRAEIGEFTPTAAPARQTGMFTCGACRDTGRIGDQFCWCDAGVNAKRAADDQPFGFAASAPDPETTAESIGDSVTIEAMRRVLIGGVRIARTFVSSQQRDCVALVESIARDKVDADRVAEIVRYAAPRVQIRVCELNRDRIPEIADPQRVIDAMIDQVENSLIALAPTAAEMIDSLAEWGAYHLSYLQDIGIITSGIDLRECAAIVVQKYMIDQYDPSGALRQHLIDPRDSEIAALRSEIDRLETSNAALRAEVDRLTDRLYENIEARRSLERQIANLESAIASLRDQAPDPDDDDPAPAPTDTPDKRARVNALRSVQPAPVFRPGAVPAQTDPRPNVRADRRVRVGHGRAVHLLAGDRTSQVYDLDGQIVDRYVPARAACGSGDIGVGLRSASTVTEVDPSTPVTCKKCLAILAEGQGK